MTLPNYIFKNEEVIVRPIKKEQSLNLGADKVLSEAEVVLVGQECTKYKPGEIVMYWHLKGMEDGRELPYGEEKLLIFETPKRIICSIQ